MLGDACRGLLAVLRSEEAPHVPACQRLAAGILWSMSAHKHLHGMLAEVPQSPEILAAAIHSKFDSSIQVREALDMVDTPDLWGKRLSAYIADG